MDAPGSGLAGRIRATVDSEQFELSGYTKEQCGDLVRAAFREPFNLSKMVRLSFVVGGGKQCRQKYNDDLPKDLMAELTALGFVDDKTASCEITSAGSFKYQWDTSKNLKLVHVFPNLVVPAESSSATRSSSGAEHPAAAAAQERDPAEILATCSIEDFQQCLEARVGGYIQKKTLLERLKERLAKVELFEEKLIGREKLEEADQAFYDSHSVDGLREKVRIVTTVLQEMVDEGRLTADEKGQCLEQLDSKIAALNKDLKKAKEDSKAKLQQKLEEQLKKLKELRTGVAAAPPVPVSLRHGSEIKDLREKLKSLRKLEEYKASGNMKISETEFKRRLRERPEIEEAIKVMEDKNRMWFETEEQFQKRLTQGLFDFNSAAIKRKEQETRSAVILNRGSKEERPKAAGKENNRPGKEQEEQQAALVEIPMPAEPQKPSESFDKWYERMQEQEKSDEDGAGAQFRPAARPTSGADGKSKAAPKPKQKKWAKIDVFAELRDGSQATAQTAPPATETAAEAEAGSEEDPPERPAEAEAEGSTEEAGSEAGEGTRPHQQPAPAPIPRPEKKEKESRPAQPPPKPRAKRQFKKALDVELGWK